MARLRTIGAAERRARLARRHRLAPGSRTGDVVEAATSLVCLHGTDPSTIYLSAWARVDGFRIADLDRAFYEDRSLIKHMAMRRTLWVVPRPALGDVQAGASARVADRERRRLIADVERAGLFADGARWLDDACAQVVAALADGREATSSELRDELPVLEGAIMYGEGKSWGGMVPIGPRVMTVLSADGRIVRGSNLGGWNSSRPRWTAMGDWLGAPLEVPSADAGVVGLVERWLRAFGPGTELDIKWWLGGTLRAVRSALAALDAVAVELDGRTGWLLPDDLEPVGSVSPWAALLPPLDPTTMGWAERAWYLGPYRELLFDAAGNGGTTMWWDGRIVGGWRQDEDGAVELQPLEDCGADARKAFDAEAARLTEWFGGTRILPRFPSPLSRRLAESGA